MHFIVQINVFGKCIYCTYLFHIKSNEKEFENDINFKTFVTCYFWFQIVIKGEDRGGHFYTFKGPFLLSGYRPHLFIDFDQMLYGSLH